MHRFKLYFLARAACALSLPVLAVPAWAHEGHGQSALGHWHASDLLGLGLGLVAAIMIWQSLRGK